MVKKSKTEEAETRKLILIRHSKAEDFSSEISDFERSLTVRGKVNSRLMAEILKAKGEEPGRVITSPAFRALETALIFCREYEISPAEIRLARNCTTVSAKQSSCTSCSSRAMKITP